MTRVTGTEHILLLLRERLSRAGGTRGARPGCASAARADPRPIERLRAMAGFDALGEDERRRAIVHGLLADELGDAVANDAAFVAVLDDVMRIIADIPDGTALIDRAGRVLHES